MYSTTLPIIGLLYDYSYAILLPLATAEGPIITVIAGFLISIGFMAFIPTYITVVGGDLLGDVFFYLAGRYLIESKIHRLFGWIGVNEQKIEASENAMRSHRGKILFFGKLYHAVGVPILIAAGALKIPIKDFLWFNFLASLPKSLAFLMVGYFFGSTLTSINKYLGWTAAGLALAATLGIAVYIILRRSKKAKHKV
jgi:membrane protein DedA with SNARE-associated domain